MLESSEVEDEVWIGPFAHLRPGSSIGRNAKLGNYAEVKNSRLEAGVQQHHMSYLGDAHVGERTNIGAGTITANYDGQHKYPTTIGERAFIGVDTMIVAPRTIGDRAKTGAGAVADPRRARRHAGRRHARPDPRTARSGRGRAAGVDGPAAPDRTATVHRAMSLPITELLFIVLLTILEGFFVASEIALVSIRRSRVEQLIEEGNRGARRVRRLLDDPGRFLAVAQIGLTFLGFFASAYAAVSLVDRLTGLLEQIPVARGVGGRDRPGRRDDPPRPVHDHLRRARPQDPRPGPPRALRDRPSRVRSTSSAASWGRSSRS